MKFSKFLLVIISCIALLFTQSCGATTVTPVDGGALTHRGELVHWKTTDFPLYVLIDDQLPDSYIDAAYEAVDTWNSEVGFSILKAETYDFSRPAPRDHGFIAVSSMDLGKSARNPDSDILGLATPYLHKGSSHIKVVQVWYDEELREGIISIVILHELGHALSLAHDDDCTSIMHPYVTNCEREYVTIKMSDVERIKDMVSNEDYFRGVHRSMMYVPESWRHLQCNH